MFKVICVSVLACWITVSSAQGNLSAQIDSVHSAFNQQERNKIAIEVKRHALEAKQEAARKRDLESMQVKERLRQANIDAASKVIQGRDRNYRDQLRNLNIQEKKLALQSQQIQVDRQNDFIDQQLKQNAAQTDMVKSKADATRNISEGAKSLLQDTGKARVKESERWFK